MDFDAHGFQFRLEQCPRTDEVDVSTHGLEAVDIGAGDAAVVDITDDDDLQAVDMAFDFLNGEHVEEALRRMFVGAITGVDDDRVDAAVGKPTGNDLREGKISLPLLYVLGRDDLPGRDAIKALLDRDGLTDTDIAAIQAFARDNGGIDYAYAAMEKLRRRAYECLRIFPESDGRRELEELFDFTIARQF